MFKEEKVECAGCGKHLFSVLTNDSRYKETTFRTYRSNCPFCNGYSFKKRCKTTRVHAANGLYIEQTVPDVVAEGTEAMIQIELQKAKK